MALFQPDDTFSTAPFAPAGAPLPAGFNSNPTPGTIMGAAHVPMDRIGPGVATSDPRVATWADVQRDNAQGSVDIARREQPTSVDALFNAFHGQESGGGANTTTSIDNAHGDMQIIPATFAAYARPGENIDNRADNIAVGKRILADLNQRYSGDPARVAVAYFSGPGNVAPPGSPTPWRVDSRDGQGTSVSTYVGGILGRLGKGGAPAAPGQPERGVQVAQGPSTVMSDAAVDAPAQAVDDGGLPPAIAAAQRKLTPITPINVPLPSMGKPSAAPAADGLPDTIRKAQDAITPPAPTPDVAPNNPFLTAQPQQGEEEPKVIALGPDGEPVFADAKDQEAYNKGMIEFPKGIASGVAQDVTGAGEWLPNSLGGGAAARATKYLQGTGDPAGQLVGRFAPLALPVSEGAMAAGGAAKAMMTEGGPLLANMARGALGGLRGAAPVAATEPTGKEDERKRFPEKDQAATRDLTLGAATAGVTPAIAPAAGRIASWLGKEIGGLPTDIMDALGGKGRKAAEELLTNTNKETGRALSAQEREAAEIEVRERLARQVAKHEEADVAAQEEKAGRAKLAEDMKIKEHAELPVSKPEEVGETGFKAVLSDIKLGKDARREQSGFKAAVDADRGKPSIETPDFQKRLSQIEHELDVDLSGLKGNLRTKSVVEGGNAEEKVTIKRGREFLHNIDREMEETTSTQLRHDLEGVRDKFLDHMETTHPSLKTAREKYAELSRPLDSYRDKGALARAARQDLYSKKSELDPTKIANELTKNTADGAAALRHLVETNPELKPKIDGMFMRELTREGATKRTPTVEQIKGFLEKRRLALDAAGLTEKYERMLTDRSALEEARKTATDTAETARGSLAGPGEGSKDTKKALDEIVADRAQVAKRAEDIKDFQREIKGISGKRISEVPGEATRIAGAMKTAKVIDGPTYERMVDEIGKVKDQFKNESDARKKITAILIAGTAIYEGHSFLRHTLNPFEGP